MSWLTVGPGNAPLASRPEITLDRDPLTSDADPDQQLVTYTAKPESVGLSDASIPSGLLMLAAQRRIAWSQMRMYGRGRYHRGSVVTAGGMGMAVFRILEGRARPGRVDEIARLFEAQAEAVGGTRGIAFVQVLRSGDQVLGISCWKSGEDMRRYLELDETRAFYGQLPPLLMGTPSIRTYEVVKSLAGGGASEVLDWMDA